MKTKSSGAAAKAKAPARAAVRSKKSTGHALAFFEYLQLPGMPAAEAGPVCVVSRRPLDGVESYRECIRIAGQLPSPLNLGGVAKLPGRVVHILKNTASGEGYKAFNSLIEEMNAAKWSQQKAEETYFDKTHRLYSPRPEQETLGEMLRGFLWDKEVGGSWPDCGCVVISHVESWLNPIEISAEILGDVLASIYGPGAVYFADDVAELKTPAPKQRRPRKVTSAAEEKPPFDTNTDPDDDLPGDEWKKA